MRVISLKFLVVAAILVLLLLLFGFIADEAVLEKENQFDLKVFALLSPLATSNIISAMQTISFFGSRNFLLAAYIILVAYLLIRRKFRNAIDVSVIGLTSALLTFILKDIFQRQRPDMPLINGIMSYSFPSGHTVSSFVFACILIHLLWERKIHLTIKWSLSVLIILIALLIGLSRILLRVHYPTDVIAGYCLASSWLIISFWLLRRITPTS